MSGRARRAAALGLLLAAVGCAGEDPAAGKGPGAQVVRTPGGDVAVRCEVVRATIRDEQGAPTAEMCGFAYLGQDPQRPVTFFWNGGPGFPAVLLHLGFAAPWTADLAEGGVSGDNPLTLVDQTDLVYVDPVGTGFSRAVAPASDADFYGVFEDADAAAQFVAAVVAERGWSERPIYLCGESYAGLRLGAMLAPLRERGVVPAGLVLISALLDTSTLAAGPDSDAGRTKALDFVPTLAALAAHDEQVPAPDGARAHVEAAVRFSRGALREAVAAGDELEDLEDERVREVLDQLTPIPTQRLLRGRDNYDCRDRFRGSRIAGMKAGGRDDELRRVLRERFGLDDAGDYSMTARRFGVGFAWRGRDGDPYLSSQIDAAEMIARACEGGGGPRVFVAGGWFDCVVPFAVARRLHVDGAFGGCDVTLKDYAAGHMIYVDPAAHRALAEDLRAWLAAAPR